MCHIEGGMAKSYSHVWSCLSFNLKPFDSRVKTSKTLQYFQYFNMLREILSITICMVLAAHMPLNVRLKTHVECDWNFDRVNSNDTNDSTSWQVYGIFLSALTECRTEIKCKCFRGHKCAYFYIYFSAFFPWLGWPKA